MRSVPAPYEPYHRATIGQRGAWWRLVVTFVLGVVALVGLQLALVTLYRGINAALAGDGGTRVGPGLLLTLNLSLAALVVVAMLLTMWPGGLRARYVCSIEGRFRRAEARAAAWRAAIVWAPLFALGMLSLLITGQLKFTSTTVVMLLVVWLTQPLQCAGEEFLFRGAFLQACGAARMPVVVACVLTAVVFSAAHLQFAPPLFVDRALLGLAFAYVVLATGGLEAAIMLHCAVNLTGLSLASFMGDVESSLAPDLSQAGATLWVAVGFHAVQLGIVVPWIVHGYRRRHGRVPSEGRPAGW